MAGINPWDGNGGEPWFDGTGGDDIRRPQGEYDDLVRFIVKFPLRLFIVFGGIALLLYLAMCRDNMTGDALWGATIGYIVGFFVILGEAVYGKLTWLIKSLLLRAVMRAEDKSKLL